MKYLAKLISYLTHPLLLTFYTIIFLPIICPDIFKQVKPMEMKQWHVMTFCNTFLYSFLVVILLWKLDFIKNIYLRDPKERFVPYMASSIFYFWNFYVHHRTPYSPHVYNSFLLGVFITLTLLFIGNIFMKASMHMAGITGLFAFMVLLMFKTGCPSIIYIAMLLAIVAIVFWSRNILSEHTKAELIVGMLIGVVSQVGVWFWY